MKNRYLVCAGMAYFPDPGWQDCYQGRFDTPEEARQAVAEVRNIGGEPYAWWQIVDESAGKMVEQGGQ